MKRGLLTWWSEDVMGFDGPWKRFFGVLTILIICGLVVALSRQIKENRIEREAFQKARVEWTAGWASFKKRHNCRLMAVQVGSVEEVSTRVYKGRERYRDNPSDTWLCRGVQIKVRSGFVPTGAEQSRLERLIEESAGR